MTFADRMIHELTILRVPLDDTVRDELGQPTEGTLEQITVMGLVQPKTAKEQADYRSAGAQISTDTIYLLPTTLYGSDVLEDASGRLYDITGIRSLEYGSTPHLEVDAQLITPAPTVPVGS